MRERERFGLPWPPQGRRCSGGFPCGCLCLKGTVQIRPGACPVKALDVRFSSQSPSDMSRVGSPTGCPVPGMREVTL